MLLGWLFTARLDGTFTLTFMGCLFIASIAETMVRFCPRKQVAGITSLGGANVSIA